MALEISNQYLYTGRGPFDAKSLVKTYAELLLEETWLSANNKNAAYNGMIVAVWLNKEDTSKNGIYYLYDATVTTTFKAPDVTVEGNWHKLCGLEDIQSLATQISTLRDTTASHSGRISSIEEKVNTFFAAVENPDEIYDTLTEIQKYITEDKSGAAAMAASIKANEEAIEKLNGEGEGSVAYAISEAVNAQAETDAAKYATQTDVNGLKAVVSSTVTLADFEEFKVENTQAITDAKADVIEEVESKGYAKAADIVDSFVSKGAFEGHVNSAESTYAKAAAVNAELAKKIESAIIAHTSDKVTEGATVNDTVLAIVIDSYKKSETYTKDEVNTAITNKIGEMTGGESAADVLVALNDYKKAADAEIYGSDKVAAWTDETGKYTPTYSQDSRIDTLDSIIAAVKEQADKSVEDVANIASELAKLSSGAVANNTSAISAINTQLAQKADLANVYTKDESANIFMTESAVDSRINALINAADPEGGKTITDIQNLVKYVDENASEISTLITNVEKNLNDIVAINAVIATMTQPKESTEISIATDGTLSIKEVNVNKLVQTPGDTLVLYGGGAV